MADSSHESMMHNAQDRVADLEAENARLRAALEKICKHRQVHIAIYKIVQEALNHGEK